MYCLPAQLIAGPVRSLELGQLLSVDPLLLVATVAGSDRSAWDVADVAAADAALAVISDELERAARFVDTYLSKRGYVLPQDAVQFPVLVTWSRSIARYELHAERSGEGADVQEGRIERDYLDARNALMLIAEGKLTLGANDPLAVPTAGGGAIRVTSQPRMFTRETLGRL